MDPSLFNNSASGSRPLRDRSSAETRSLIKHYVRVLLKHRALFFYQENHQYGDNDGS